VIPLEKATEADVLLAGALASQEIKTRTRLTSHSLPPRKSITYSMAFLPSPPSPLLPSMRRADGRKLCRAERATTARDERRRAHHRRGCGLQPPAIEALDARVSAASREGLSDSGCGTRTREKPTGPGRTVSLYDPPRPDAKQLIATLHDLGVPVKMLTGDALPVALEIGQGVGLPNIKRMADLKTAIAQAENKTVDLFAGADGLAEVFPEDKYTL